jgi:hypothetical protein
MEKPAVETPAKNPGQPESLSLDTVFGILWESAVDALVKSILILALGSIAIDLTAGIWREMAPSLPPGFGVKPEAEETSSIGRSAWGDILDQHRFGIIFGLVFIPTFCGRMARRNGKGVESKDASRLEKIGKRLSEEWFGLVVGNAFGAWITTIIVVWAQQFSVTKMLLHWLLEPVLAEIQTIIHHLLGAGRANAFQAWLNWYGENQLKFTFWFFYLAAICDDLGIPNFKTLGRWLGRRIRRGAKRS